MTVGPFVLLLEDMFEDVFPLEHVFFSMLYSDVDTSK